MKELYFPYDAMSSWSGYDIQGKMAVYFVLKEIFNVIENSQNCNFYDLKERLDQIIIELENFEDIAILVENEYCKVYQVKAGKNTKLKAADCYNLYIASYLVNSQRKSIDIMNKENCGVFLISTHNLDSVTEIKKRGREHIENLLSTNYENDICKDKISDIKGNQKKGSFQSLIRKAQIMDVPKPSREEKVKRDIITPLKELLKSWDELTVDLYPSECIKDSETIKDSCIDIIKQVKKIIKERCVDSKELFYLIEKTEENIYWSLVDHLDLKLFYTNGESIRNELLSENSSKGIQISIGSFLETICVPVDNSIDEVMFLSHLLRDKLYQMLNEAPQYFRDEGIIDCPEESEGCNSCIFNNKCTFIKKAKLIFNIRGLDLLNLLARLFLNENTRLRDANNLPKDDDILEILYRYIGKYSKFTYEDGILEALIVDEPVKKMIADMSTVDNATRLAKKISRIGKNDIKFVEKLFESAYLFHMHGEGSFSSFHFGNNEKFTDIISDDLTPSEMDKLKFMSKDMLNDFTGPAVVKVIGTTEAEDLLNEKAST